MADKPISGLPALPGNLNLNALLAVVQGGITYHTEVREILSGFTLATAGQATSWRVPRTPIQIAFLPAGAEVPTDQQISGVYYTPTQTFVFPQPFAGVPAVVPAGRSGNNQYGLYQLHRAVSPTQFTAVGVGLNNSQGWRFGYVAVGMY